jgi:hypothetical protein
MEIGPIPGIRLTPLPRPNPSDSELSPVCDIDPTAHIGDDTYSASEHKGASTSEPEENAAESDDPVDNETETAASFGAVSGQINFFA